MTVEEWLIEAVKIRPIIWDIKDKNYKIWFNRLHYFIMNLILLS